MAHCNFDDRFATLAASSVTAIRDFSPAIICPWIVDIACCAGFEKALIALKFPVLTIACSGSPETVLTFLFKAVFALLYSVSITFLSDLDFSEFNSLCNAI